LREVLSQTRERPFLGRRKVYLPFAQRVGVAKPKRTVYILKSVEEPARYYTGVTSDLTARLASHNAGRCPHTAGRRPWQLDVAIEFADERRALAFERYLKSGSGAACAQRHLR
jgi:predicted GIY-YIG superfamily endonuclease